MYIRGIKLTAQSAYDDPRASRQHRGIRLKTFHRLVEPTSPRDTRVLGAANIRKRAVRMPKRCFIAGFLTWVQVFSGGRAMLRSVSHIHHVRTHGHVMYIYYTIKSTVRASIYSGTDVLRSTVRLQGSANVFL